MQDKVRRIQVLDTLTANQIAAGEVVERPMSVVKELVENAIDAGARRITIKIRDGGLECIQVIDDGCGIVPNEMALAFQRHATSKIRQIEDVESLSTLGFRGEALPSIAAVSKVTLQSRPAEADGGYKISLQEGQITEEGEVGMAPGTVITVQDLFYNTPARKKFLKKPAAESGQVGDLISRMILARPDIAFLLQDEGKTVIHSPGTGQLDQGIFAVYGKDILSNMLPIPYNEKLFGRISRPGINRASRNYYNFFVNGRWVKSKELTKVVEAAYDTLNPDRRYPIVVLHLSLASEIIDVNVHPAKLEVRFREWDQLRDDILQLLQQTLRQPQEKAIGTASGTPVTYSLPDDAELSIRLEERKRLCEKQQYYSAASAEETHHIPFVSTNTVSTTVKPLTSQALSQPQPAKQETLSFRPSFIKQKQEELAGQPLCQERGDTSAQEKEMVTTPCDQSSTQAQTSSFWLSLHPLGQINAMYIVANGEDGLYLVDQHAAHERIRFESYRQAFQKSAGKTTQLVLPQQLALTYQQKKTLLRSLAELTDIGFLVEYFGDNDFLLRGVPAWYDKGAAEELFFAILDTIGEDERFNFSDFCREKLFLLACHSAVRANDTLTNSDISWLFRQLAEADIAFTCPHGRPIAVRISYDEISRRFLRT